MALRARRDATVRVLCLDVRRECVPGGVDGKELTCARRAFRSLGNFVRVVAVIRCSAELVGGVRGVHAGGHLHRQLSTGVIARAISRWCRACRLTCARTVYPNVAGGI